MAAVQENYYSYERISAIADDIRHRIKTRPLIAVICGSGLGPIADMAKEPVVIDYESIKDFPKCTVEGHDGQLVCGIVAGKPVLFMKGRFHVYEGYDVQTCSMPVRVLKLLGVKHLLITGAVGALNPSIAIGDLVLIKDHINMAGFAAGNPLRGANDERFGQRFVAMSQGYDHVGNDLLREAIADLDMSDFVREGIYCAVVGPSYETVAETLMMRALGADIVGMSVVHEVITAKHCSLKVNAIGMVTAGCVDNYDHGSQKEVTHDNVLYICDGRISDLIQLIELFIKRAIWTNN